MGLITHQFEDNFITTSVDRVLNWARESSIWPMGFGLACCAIEMTHFGSGIWSYNRRSTGAIFLVTVPATIIRSACRGEGRNTSAPNRARSYRAMLVAIISIAQHASPNVSGHTELRRPQL